MPSAITKQVREIRKNLLPGENALWQMLRNRNFEGKKFYRQHGIKVEYKGRVRFYIADFYCHEKKLVIEMDGKIHENPME